MWLSALAVQYRDVKYALSFAIQFLMYAAPVVYPTSLIPDPFRYLYAINPLVGVIEGFRASLLGATPVPWDLIGIGERQRSDDAVVGHAVFHSEGARLRRRRMTMSHTAISRRPALEALSNWRQVRSGKTRSGERSWISLAGP